MSDAYPRAYQGLVAGGMTADQAATLLAQLRAETGAELAAGLQQLAKAEHAEQPTDTKAIWRKRKIRYGAVMAAARWVLAATLTGHTTTIPPQRTDRSTP
ncbi:hypothetical protein [Streptomyces sp. NPDC090026]|uniref:hypothetical protein n=1 Tax=Streptomyces sp. NPDC090026 TaxID=3365923 RepID=UPI0037F8E356